MVREFPGIDVMFSAHSHEQTLEAIVIDHMAKVTSALLLRPVKTTSSADSISQYPGIPARSSTGSWDLIEANSEVAEDPAISALVDRERKTFVSGPDFECHTFGTNAFPFGKGHTLCEPLDLVVGHTDPTINRFNALEDYRQQCQRRRLSGARAFHRSPTSMTVTLFPRPTDSAST